MTKRVLIAGFTGAMGQKAVNLVNSLSDFKIVAGLSPSAENDPQNNIFCQRMLQILIV